MKTHLADKLTKEVMSACIRTHFLVPLFSFEQVSGRKSLLFFCPAACWFCGGGSICLLGVVHITQQSLLWEKRSASFFSICSFTLKRYRQRLQIKTAFDYLFFQSVIYTWEFPLPQLSHGREGWNGNVNWFHQGEKWTFKVEKSFFFNRFLQLSSFGLLFIYQGI